MTLRSHVPFAYAYDSLGPTLNVLAAAAVLAAGVLAILLAAYLASLPGRIAVARGHSRAEAINVCGWLGLVTGVGWIVALVWAFAEPSESAPNVSERVAALNEAVRELEALTGRTHA